MYGPLSKAVLPAKVLFCVKNLIVLYCWKLHTCLSIL